MEKTIVIGGGLMGSSAAWQLSRQGEQVLLIEQQQSVYKNGSSYGESRIARSLGPEDDIFSYLHNKSVAEAKQLISFLNAASNGNTHSMEDIYTHSPVTYVFDHTSIEEMKAICHEKQTDAYKIASHTNAHEVLGMTIPSSDTVIREFTDYSGTFNPRVLIAKLHEGIRQYGNRILYGYKIAGISRKHGHYEIEAVDLQTQETKLFLTEKLVVAAGPYTGELLKHIAPQFGTLITPKRVFTSFFKIKASVYLTYSADEKEAIRQSQPSYFQYDGLFYSMIDRIDDDGLPVFKAGAHGIYHSIENMDECWNTQPTDENVEWVRERLYRYLKMLNISIQESDLEYVHKQSCVYSLTVNGLPFVTPATQGDNSMVVIGGMNGIGGKGSMCYGLIAANLLLGKEEEEAMYKKTLEALRK
ncbi:FAD-dependent oxidoreductase [Fulvivirga ulvae]|uniref:NAD(P)/FAD-dependent oxidoreductase n=1 Tax=Fulvivirga ulvae TaxID=2904245 RepID=UPI001F2C5232|nr:FAD-dependent oxidoreductase [Fulvivirga ulvae]UII33571.1 FAD-dependent oxidoreductase [Fulvivirga ulvae]